MQAHSCLSDFRAVTDDFDTFDTFRCKPRFFIVHCSVIVANAASGFNFPTSLVYHMRKTNGFGEMFSCPLS